MNDIQNTTNKVVLKIIPYLMDLFVDLCIRLLVINFIKFLKIFKTFKTLLTCRICA